MPPLERAKFDAFFMADHLAVLSLVPMMAFRMARPAHLIELPTSIAGPYRSRDRWHAGRRTANDRGIAKLLTPALTKAGFDIRKIEKLLGGAVLHTRERAGGG